jgi:hypothetical protein
MREAPAQSHQVLVYDDCRVKLMIDWQGVLGLEAEVTARAR